VPRNLGAIKREVGEGGKRKEEKKRERERGQTKTGVIRITPTYGLTGSDTVYQESGSKLHTSWRGLTKGGQAKWGLCVQLLCVIQPGLCNLILHRL
jgi:hypothetical protein